MGVRYLVDPEPAAAGFGIPGEFGESAHGPAWLAVKASRDLAIAIVIAILLIAGAHRELGYPMLAIALIRSQTGRSSSAAAARGPSPTVSTGPPPR